MARKKKPPRIPPPPPDPPVSPTGDPADLPLTDDERAFVDEYLVHRDRYAAYRAAFPNGVQTARQVRANARALSARPHVAAEMRAAVAAQSVRTQITADRTLKELARIAFSDVLDLYDPATGNIRQPRHIPFDTRRAIASVRVARERRTVRTAGATRTTVADSIIEYKFWPKLPALEKLCAHLGLKTEITPLEALLASLPRPLALAVRAALSEGAQTAPSANGVHK